MSNISFKKAGSLRIIRDPMVHVEWEIPKFFDLPHNGYQHLESDSFMLSDAEWCIHIYPNVNSNIQMYFINNFSPEDVLVSFTIGIKKADGSVLKSFCDNKLFAKAGDYWEAPEISRSKLISCKDTVTREGALAFFLTACVLDGAAASSHTVQSDGLKTLSQNFKDLFLSENESDVTFKVIDKECRAHKLVLAARSTVLKAMFEADMVEKNNGIVNIPDSDPVDFQNFLLYLYSGELGVVTSTNALGLYYLADKYNLQELKGPCCEWLTWDMSVDSFCDVVLLASLHNETQLLETCTDFFITHANNIFPTPKWAKFAIDHFTVANELLIKLGQRLIK